MSLQLFDFHFLLSDETRLDPAHYCSCTNCCKMDTVEESSCCHSKKKLMPGACITDDETFNLLLNPTVLEVNLRSVWSAGVIDTKDKEINNENLRYSAYRSIYLWLNKRRKFKKGRFPLPSCVVAAVRKKYPSNLYKGFSFKN